MQFAVVQKINFPDTRDTADGTFGRNGLHTEVLGCSRIEGDTTAAGIEDKIEGIGVVIDQRMQNDHASRQLGKRHCGQVPGGRLNKLLLGPECKGTEAKEEDKEAGQAILHAVRCSIRGQVLAVK
jgi:hypothetical protein